MKKEHYEKLTVVLAREAPASRKEFHTWLKRRGYKSEDDFYYLKRKGRIPPWQTDAIVTVDIRLNSSAIYETEEDVEEGSSTAWNSLKLDYLMASLPRECIELFLEEVEQISNCFGLEVKFELAEVDVPSLRASLNVIADSLDRDFGGAGSEELAILIAQEYAR
ncbi:hypothetical protein [Pseudoduganella violaceinigra]|uniref:hypothetical protein n=1 Tax=Pseudoduganella violaceinigra TaxID=246602 RepID=UPI0012B5C99D|nr:hypothetical protein [Pseudoduganella violaceinigra]